MAWTAGRRQRGGAVARGCHESYAHAPSVAAVLLLSRTVCLSLCLCVLTLSLCLFLLYRCLLHLVLLPLFPFVCVSLFPCGPCLTFCYCIRREGHEQLVLSRTKPRPSWQGAGTEAHRHVQHSATAGLSRGASTASAAVLRVVSLVRRSNCMLP